MRISDWSSDVCSSDLVYAKVRQFIRHPENAGWQSDSCLKLDAETIGCQLEPGYFLPIGAGTRKVLCNKTSCPMHPFVSMSGVDHMKIDGLAHTEPSECSHNLNIGSLRAYKELDTTGTE